MRQCASTCGALFLLLSPTTSLLSNDALDFKSLSKLDLNQAFAEPVSASTFSVPSVGRALSASTLSQSDDSARSYTRFRLGPYWHTDDLSGMGAGIYGQLLFGHYLIGRLLALEADIGVFYNDGSVRSVDVDVLGVPLFLNARLTLPVFFLEAHGGLGIGGVYGNVLARPAGVSSIREEDIVFAGNAFLGLTVQLGPLGVGVEGKYILTEKADDFRADLDLAALLASVSFRF